MTLLILICVAAAGLGWLALGIRKINAVSTGNPIAPHSKTAVLLIDLQSVFWDHGPYSAEAKTTAQRAILREVSEAKAKGHPVIAVRQEWSIPSTRAIARLAMKGQALEGSPGTELAEPFADAPDRTLVKRVQDAFETGALQALLEELEVGHLRLLGLDFNYCVLKTALAARNRGYDVTLVVPGTLAAAPADASTQRLLRAGVILSEG